MLQPLQWTLGTNVGIFGAAAVFVWIAGTRMARYADQLAERTGLRREFLGVVLLGGMTSLPELAVGLSDRLLERRDRTVLRMGLDSLAVLITYGVGLFVLYGLR